MMKKVSKIFTALCTKLIGPDEPKIHARMRLFLPNRKIIDNIYYCIKINFHMKG